MVERMKSFGSEKGFCWNCGTILPTLIDEPTVKCCLCKSVYGPEVFGAMENHYEINFHSPKDYLTVDNLFKYSDPAASRSKGPVVERKCIRCGNDIMSYVTLQMRSADEGQTVFYTCTKCGHKETENS